MNALKKNNNNIHLLIEECIKNNKKAQLKIYELFAAKMYNTCLRMIGNSATAEDIMQEAFLSAFRSIKDFRKEVPFEAWLRRIIVNKTLDYLRKEKKSNLEFYEKIEEKAEPITIENDIDYEAVRKKLIKHIKEEMMLLPEGYRVIFSLYYFEGYDHDEIGQILNISPSSSRSQLTRAKQRITNNLKQKPD